MPARLARKSRLRLLHIQADQLFQASAINSTIGEDRRGPGALSTKDLRAGKLLVAGRRRLGHCKLAVFAVDDQFPIRQHERAFAKRSVAPFNLPRAEVEALEFVIIKAVDAVLPQYAT